MNVDRPDEWSSTSSLYVWEHTSQQQTPSCRAFDRACPDVDWLSLELLYLLCNHFSFLKALLPLLEYPALYAGQASLSCASIAIGGLGALDEPLSAVVVQSPSSHCTRLLATADLHAAASRVQTKPAKTQGSFLVVRFGRGLANAENQAVRQGGKEPAAWQMLQPSGMEIDVEAAGIEVITLCCYVPVPFFSSTFSWVLLVVWYYARSPGVRAGDERMSATRCLSTCAVRW